MEQISALSANNLSNPAATGNQTQAPAQNESQVQPQPASTAPLQSSSPPAGSGFESTSPAAGEAAPTSTIQTSVASNAAAQFQELQVVFQDAGNAQNQSSAGRFRRYSSAIAKHSGLTRRGPAPILNRHILASHVCCIITTVECRSRSFRVVYISDYKRINVSSHRPFRCLGSPSANALSTHDSASSRNGGNRASYRSSKPGSICACTCGHGDRVPARRSRQF